MKSPRLLVLLAVLSSACSDVPTGPGEDDGLSPRWTDVSLGAHHTCALRSDGTVFCWGRNEHHQVAPLPDSILTSPQAVTLAFPVDDLAVGGTGSCALDQEGRLSCWGGNDRRQLGFWEAGDVLEPRAVDAPAFATASMGSIHSCGVDGSGTVYCWGGGGSGPGRDMAVGHYLHAPCADPDGNTYFNQFCSPSPLAIPLGGPVREVGTGIFYSCVLMESGPVQCWGLNTWGQLGDGVDPEKILSLYGRFEARPVNGLGIYRDLTVGNVLSCALDEPGNAYCWGVAFSGGSLSLGQMGRGLPWREEIGARVPVPVAGDVRFRSIVANQENSIYAANVCGISLDDGLYCWGTNERGQLGGTGTGETCWRDIACATIPTPVAVGTRFAKVALGMYHLCALTLDGELVCWGENGYGQLGVGDTLGRPTPQTVLLPTS